MWRSSNTGAIATLLGSLSLFVALGVVSLASFTVATPAVAQVVDEEEPAADGATPAASGSNQTILGWVWEALGPLYTFLFLLISFIFVALFVMNIISAQRGSICPAHLVENFEMHLDQKEYQEAYDLAKSDESFLGHVLSAGLGQLSRGYAQAIEAMQERGEEESMKLEHRLSYIALIGTISPMVGLFGTVHGMINSFSEIAKGGTPSPDKLARGISTALFTTLVGLAIAIPAILVYQILKNRVSRLVLDVGITSEMLMARFQTSEKK